MAFFHTSKLPKRQLYGSRLVLGQKTGSATRSASGLCSPSSDCFSLSNNLQLPSHKKSLSLTSHLVSDEEFVHNINQIIDRKNFRLIERPNEMRTEADQVHIQINCNGFLPREIQVRAIGEHRLEVHGEHLEFLSQKLAIRKQMHRCYPLPDDTDIQQIHCLFAKSGVLHIKVPRYPTSTGAREPDVASSKTRRPKPEVESILTGCGAQNSAPQLVSQLKHTERDKQAKL
jgi:HSP20 family molecular chaperone IbpA